MAKFTQRPDTADRAPQNRIWKFLNRHGNIVAVNTRKQYEEAVKRPGMTFLGEEATYFPGDEPVAEEPVAEAPVAAPVELSCDKCDFKTESEPGLKRHQRVKHSAM